MKTEVIAGGTDTIQKLRPAIFIENDRKQNAEKLILSLLNLNY